MVLAKGIYLYGGPKGGPQSKGTTVEGPTKGKHGRDHKDDTLYIAPHAIFVNTIGLQRPNSGPEVV